MFARQSKCMGAHLPVILPECPTPTSCQACMSIINTHVWQSCPFSCHFHSLHVQIWAKNTYFPICTSIGFHPFIKLLQVNTKISMTGKSNLRWSRFSADKMNLFCRVQHWHFLDLKPGYFQPFGITTLVEFHATHLSSQCYTILWREITGLWQVLPTSLDQPFCRPIL